MDEATRLRKIERAEKWFKVIGSAMSITFIMGLASQKKEFDGDWQARIFSGGAFILWGILFLIFWVLMDYKDNLEINPEKKHDIPDDFEGLVGVLAIVLTIESARDGYGLADGLSGMVVAGLAIAYERNRLVYAFNVWYWVLTSLMGLVGCWVLAQAYMEWFYAVPNDVGLWYAPELWSAVAAFVLWVVLRVIGGQIYPLLSLFENKGPKPPHASPGGPEARLKALKELRNC